MHFVCGFAAWAFSVFLAKQRELFPCVHPVHPRFHFALCTFHFASLLAAPYDRQVHDRHGRRGGAGDTGVMCAIEDHKLSSAVGFRGLCRKVLTFLLVGIALVLDVHVLNQPGVLRTAVIFWAIANNGLSILENAAHLGLPVPEQLKEVLEQLHNRDQKSGEPQTVDGESLDE